MAKSSESARLEEVKTLLHQLQRIRSDTANSENKDAPKLRLRPGLPARRKRSVRPGLIVATALLFLAAGVTGAVFLRYRPAPETHEATTAAISRPVSLEPPSTPGGAPEQRPDTDTSLSGLNDVQQMMLGGDILAAREVLLKSADSGPPDIALALARSYDPNVLRAISNPNAAPDIEKATDWYRRWHRAAVESGQITDTLQLERILRSMR